MELANIFISIVAIIGIIIAGAILLAIVGVIIAIIVAFIIGMKGAIFGYKKGVGQFEIHTVRKGETLHSIAVDHDVNWLWIKQDNSLASNDVVEGQRLMIRFDHGDDKPELVI